MVGPTPQATVLELFEAFAARDAAAADRVLHPDVELWAQPTAERVGRREPYRGRDGFRRYLADVDRAWDSFDVEPVDFRVAGAGVICFGHAAGTPRRGTDPVRVPVIWVFRLRDGLIAFVRVARTAAEATAFATEPGAAAT